MMDKFLNNLISLVPLVVAVIFITAPVGHESLVNQIPFAARYSWIPEFLSKIGEALFVSIVAAFTIERKARIKQTEEINDIVHQVLYNETHKKALQDFFGSDIRFKSISLLFRDVLCKKSDMFLDLKCKLLPDGSILRKKNLSYQISSESDKPVNYSITTYDKYTDSTKEMTFVDRVRIANLDNWQNKTECIILSETASKDEIIKEIAKTLTNGHIIELTKTQVSYFLQYNEFGEMSLEIPIEVPSGVIVKCSIQSVGITSLPGTYDFLNSSIAEDLKISVTYPCKLSLKVKALHPQKDVLQEKYVDESLDELSIKQNWHLSSSILPYWGVSFKFSNTNEFNESNLVNIDAANEYSESLTVAQTSSLN
jgi:hypothetical protein